MDKIFFPTFWISFFASAGVFIPALIGFFGVRTKIVKTEVADYLSELVIYITLPLMIFTHIIDEFSFSTLRYWWVFPLVSFGMIVISYFLASVLIRIIGYERNQMEFKMLVSFQNSGYLPLALASALLKQEEAGMGILYIIFFLMGFNLLIWSWGVHMFKNRRANVEFSWTRLFSPPFLAVLFSLILVLIGAKRIIPEIILKQFRAFGNTTVPLGMFIVGASLANSKFLVKLDRGILGIIFLRLIIIPSLFLSFLYILRIPYLTAFVILLEASMPSATSLAVIATVYGGNREYISQGILFTHLISFVTIPLFLSLFNIIFKISG